MREVDEERAEEGLMTGFAVLKDAVASPSIVYIVAVSYTHLTLPTN